VRDNVIRRDNDIAINMPGYSSDYQRGVSDIYIVHNTVINNGTNGKFLKVGGAVDGVTVTNNLYVAPNLETGAYDAAPMHIGNNDLSGFRLIANNVWPAATILDAAHGGINYVGDDGNTSGYKTPTQWENYSQVHDDAFKDVTLKDSYMINLNGEAVGSDMKKAA
jgi:hypothetical protein